MENHQFSVQSFRAGLITDVSTHETQEAAEEAAIRCSHKDLGALFEVWDETENEESGEPLSEWKAGLRVNQP